MQKKGSVSFSACSEPALDHMKPHDQLLFGLLGDDRFKEALGRGHSGPDPKLGFRLCDEHR